MTMRRRGNSSSNHPTVARVGKAHKRGVSTTLQIVDETLCEVEQWAEGREMQSILYTERNTLSSRQRKAILSEIARMRTVLKDLQCTLGLEPAVQDGRAAIRSKCAGLWEHVVELKAKHLRRYGDVPSDLAESLDPQVDLLIQGLLAILDALSGKHATSTPTKPGRK